MKNAPAGLLRLFVLDGKLWGATDDALYLFKDRARSADKVFEGKIVDMCMHNGVVHAATRDDVYRYANGAFVNIKPKSGWLSSNTTMIMEDGSQVLIDPVRLGPIERIASYSGTLYLLQPGGLTLLDGATFVTEPVDWGAMPSRKHRDMLVLGSRLMTATDRGIAVLRGAALTSITGKDGLPCENTTCLAAGFDADSGSEPQPVRFATSASNITISVLTIGCPATTCMQSSSTKKLCTSPPIAELVLSATNRTRCAKKAAFFEQQVEAGGHKRLGFVHRALSR